jgi:hypothetical protein
MNQLPRKRPRPTSYTQSAEDGDNPKAYTPEYEEVLAKAGIFMNARQRQATASNDCQKLCKDLLNCEYDIPDDSLFHGELFWAVLDRVHIRNKSRVSRDIMPSIVPSDELLYLRGSDHLEHLTEELNAVWTKCSALAGPRPKPAFCVGLMSSAFTEEEILKLKSYTAPNKATLVTENLYFPFLMCEATSGEQALIRPDRQNAHSSSIAVNALVQLYRAVPLIDDPHHEERASSRVEELNRKILAFSISHDHTSVKIYGHYAIIDGDKETFYRHAIYNIDITNLDEKERWATYNLTRKVYDEFAPLHLQRIRSAIAQLPDPSSVPINASKAGSHEFVTATPSSQESAIFKRPSLLASVTQKQEIARLTEQIDEYKQREQDKKQREQDQKQREQDKKQREQDQKQREQDQKQREQDQKQEIARLTEQIDEYKKQREQDQKQWEQDQETIKLLRQLIPGGRSSNE